VCLASLLGLWAARAGEALADGDPASDVLATQKLFLPQDGAIPATQQAQLQALVQSAARAGYPVRAAVIASRADLGSVTALWRQPAGYARFLGQELSQVFRGTLLVVMPNGFGVYRVGPSTGSGGATGTTGTTGTTGSAGAASSALSGLPAADAGTPVPGALGGAALAAVQRLAAAAGHHLAAPRGAAPRRAAARSGVDVAAWLAFAVGAILIAAAWTVSLRVRPSRQHDGVASPHGS
jgi:hypothetical protein